MNTKKEEESEENLSSTNVEGVQAGRSPQGEQKQEVTVVEGIETAKPVSRVMPKKSSPRQLLSKQNQSSTVVEGAEAGKSPQGEKKKEVTVVEGIDVEEKQSSTTPIEENQSSTVVEEKMKEFTVVEGIDAEEKQSLTTPIMDKRSTASMKKLEKYLRTQATVV